MREIKFRAWDTEKRKMYHQTSSEWYLDDEYDSLTFPFETGVWGHNDTYILMQYTGLKDKNGKEIYEGDIVKWLYGDQEQTDMVSYANGHFLVHSGPLDEDKHKNTHEDLWKVLRRYGVGRIGENTVEVIGNIYENPELLRKVRGR